MAAEPIPPAETQSKERWPRQIKFIVGNEAAERFSYYGMKSILALYITKALLQSKDTSTTIIHVFGFVNYFMPLFGAWVSDRYWGRYRTILWISLFYCAGHGVLATSDFFPGVDAKLWCLYLGLGLIAFGSGGIKPCVSAFMGDQFRPDQQHLMRKAYGAFYFSINFGSFFSFLVIPWIAAKPALTVAADANFLERLLWQVKNAGFSGYSWAFGVPGILMGLATLIFYLGTKYYVRVPPAKETRTAGFFTVFLAALKAVTVTQPGLRFVAYVNLSICLVLPALAMIFMVFAGLHREVTPTVKLAGIAGLVCLGLWNLLILVATALKVNELPDSFWEGARSRFNSVEISAARSIAPIISVFAFIPVFWSLFEQSNSTWVLQGAQMREIVLAVGQFKVAIGAEQMQSLNPLLVMILVPVLTWGLYPAVERMGLRATALRRIAFGLGLTAFSYVVVAWLQNRIERGESLTLGWQAVPYIILTIGEVLVSTTGLEFAYTQAAPSMKSTIMSFWLLTMAIGNILVATITQVGGGHGDASVSSGRFLTYAAMTGVVAAFFVLVAVRYQYRDHGPGLATRQPTG